MIKRTLTVRAFGCAAALASACSPQTSAAPRPADGSATPAVAPAGATGAAPRTNAARPSARAAGNSAAASPAAEKRAPRFEDHQVPAGMTLALELRTSIDTDRTRVEDEVRARLTRAIVVNDVEVVPAGASVHGIVTEVERSGRVKGLARVAMRFSVIEHPETNSHATIRTSPIVYEAEPTKKKDAAKIGGAAAGGAIIGAIVGGGDGAAKGAAIGGAAGTGVVLSTRGAEVRLPAGTALSAHLISPFVVRIPAR
jgi:hypothetical protein